MPLIVQRPHTPEEEKALEANGFTYPYCPGCGHRFYYMKMVPSAEAQLKFKCHFCLEDAEFNG